VVFEKVKNMISTYQEKDIKNIDWNLLRGLFTKNLKDFEEDENDIIQNKVLI
jgi:hypothetical protein